MYQFELLASEVNMILVIGPSGSSSPGISSPGGVNTNVQYNDSGSLAGDGNLTWDKLLHSLTVSGLITASGIAALGNIIGNALYANSAVISGLLTTNTLSMASYNTSADYTLTTSDTYVLVDASSQAITITLRALSSVPRTTIIIKKTDTSYNKVIINAAGADLIDNNSSVEITQPNDSLTLFAGNTMWRII